MILKYWTYFYNYDVACDTMTLQPATDPMMVKVTCRDEKNHFLTRALLCMHSRKIGPSVHFGLVLDFSEWLIFEKWGWKTLFFTGHVIAEVWWYHNVTSQYRNMQSSVFLYKFLIYFHRLDDSEHSSLWHTIFMGSSCVNHTVFAFCLDKKLPFELGFVIV